MAGSVRVLGSKRRAKGVNLGQSQRECFRFELTAHGQKSRPSEEVFRIIDFAVRRSWHLFRVQRRNAKQFSSTFAIAAGDDRRVDVNKTALLKKLVNGKCQTAPHAKDATEEVRAGAEMSDFAKKFRRMALFLERVGIVGGSHDLDLLGNQFPFLSFALRRDQRANCANGCARAQPLHRRIIRQRIFRNDLKVAQARAIVQFYERKIFRIAPGPHPSLNQNRIDRCSALQSILDRNRRKRLIHTF